MIFVGGFMSCFRTQSILWALYRTQNVIYSKQSIRHMQMLQAKVNPFETAK
jgi:hypothetical protein